MAGTAGIDGIIAEARRLFDAGRIAEATAVLRSGDDIDDLDDADRLALRRAQAVVASRAGRQDEALAALSGVVEGWRDRGDLAAAADVSALEAHVHHLRGDLDAALDAGAVAIVLLDEWDALEREALVEAHDGTPVHAANMHNSLGLIYRDLEAVELAIREFSTALELVDGRYEPLAVVARANLASALLKYATSELRGADLDRANRDALTAFELTERHVRVLLSNEMPARRALEAASILISVLLNTGRYADAAEAIAGFERLSARIDDQRVLVDWHLLHSWAAREVGDLDEATHHADTAVELAETCDDAVAVPLARRERSRVREARGDLRGALDDLQGADHRVRQLRSDRTEALVEQLTRRAQLEAARRRLERETAELGREREQLREAVETDPLTSVGNRRRLTAAVTALRSGPAQTVGVLAVDVDQFKDVNDRHGHDVGDRMLVTLAEVLRRIVRDRDVVCRLGGDEFVVVVPGGQPDAALTLAERIRGELAAAPESTGPEPLSVSIGVATGRSEAIVDLLAAADGALLTAKRLGRDRVAVAGANGHQVHDTG